MTPVFCCGGECGVAGVGSHWDAVSGGSFSTSTVRSGARSIRINPSATNIEQITNALASSNIWVYRVYIRFASLPNANCALIYNKATTAGSAVGVLFKQSDSKIYPGKAQGSTLTFGSQGFTVTTGVWYRVDVKLTMNANPWTVDVSVDGNTLTQYTNAVAADAATTFSVAAANAVAGVTADIFYDDIILSNTSGDYPIGNGYVNHFVPTSDGTHTATTTTIVKGTIASPTGGGNVAGSTDVFNWVNGVPLLGGATDNTRLVNHQTAGTTLYAEVVFGPAPGILTPKYGPRAVEVITADREATTATGDFTTKINDNGTESNVIARGVVAGVITDRFATKQFATPPTGGSWGVASGAGNFNNLRARFGYASDATPDQYWRGIMVEAEFAEWPQKITQVKQAVNRSNNY